MWPLSTRAQRALVGSHSMRVRVTAYSANVGSVTDLPLSSGSVTVDVGSQTRRSGRLGFAASGHWWPDDPFAILSPLGSELSIEYGIVLDATITEWVPLIRGPIVDVRRSQPFGGDAAIEVTMADRSIRVADAKFDQPVQTLAGATTVSEIRRLITDVLPTVTVTDLTGSTQVAAQLEIERERWTDGVEKLAASIGAEVFADPLGNFTIRTQPTLSDNPVWTLANDAFSIVTGLDERATRDGAYSKVVASGQRTDGTAPVWAAVTDTDPNSPTYINGPFGTRTKFLTSNLLTTAPQCTTAATAVLARSKGMAGGLTLQAIPNPALDVGDVVTLQPGSVHIIDTLSIPLVPSDAQRITTRSTDPPPEFT